MSACFASRGFARYHFVAAARSARKARTACGCFFMSSGRMMIRMSSSSNGTPVLDVKSVRSPPLAASGSAKTRGSPATSTFRERGARPQLDRASVADDADRLALEVGNGPDRRIALDHVLSDRSAFRFHAQACHDAKVQALGCRGEHRVGAGAAAVDLPRLES